MLLISDETLDLIAGGYAPPSEASQRRQQGSIIVTISGQVPPEESQSQSGTAPGDPEPPPEGSGGAPEEPPPACVPIHSSPVPQNVPRNLDMNMLRNTMVDVANYIKQMDENIEHGALVMLAADGTLRVGEVRHGTVDEVEMLTFPLRGEVIVAYIHSHPENGLNQTLPSNHDLEAARELRKDPVADPHAMLYILDNQSGDVFEYHSNVSNNTKISGPNITDDTQQPCG